MQVLKQRFALCPQEVETGKMLAQTALDLGDVDEAEKVLRALIAHKDGPELHSLLGAALQARKRPADAAAQLQIAATMDPSEDHIFDFGISLMKVDFSAAATILRYGLKMYPQSVRMHVALALALYAQDQAEEGAQLLCEAADLDPDDVHPMEVLADTGVIPASVQTRAAQRLAALQKANPQDGLLLFDYAMVQSGRWSGHQDASSPELFAMLRKAAVLDPKLAKVHFEIALLDGAAKDVAGEIVELREAIRIDPLVARYHYRLAFVYRTAGDKDHSREELARYRALHGGAGSEK